MKKVVAVICFLMMSLVLQAQDTLTFEMAIATALENNYGIKIAKNTKAIAENNYALGNAGFLPTLDLNASFNKAVVNGEQIRGSDSEAIEDRKNKSSSAGATLNWTVFDGLAMFVNYDILEQQNMQADDELSLQIQTTVFSVADAFYRTSLETARLSSLQSTLELSEDRKQVAHDKYVLGKGSKLEFLQAQVDYNTDKSNVINQKVALKTQKYDLLRQMATKADSIDFEVKFELEMGANIDLNDALNAMRLNNPEMKAIERSIKIAKLGESLVRADRMPSIKLFTGYNYSEVQRAVGFSFTSNTHELSYGASASFRVFDGFNVSRRSQNAKIEAENAFFNYQNRMLELETMVKQAYLNYTSNLSLVELENANVAIAEENNEIAQERYRVGLSNPVELRESQVNLVNAQFRLQDAAFAAKLAELQLKYLSGRLVSNK